MAENYEDIGDKLSNLDSVMTVSPRSAKQKAYTSETIDDYSSKDEFKSRFKKEQEESDRGEYPVVYQLSFDPEESDVEFDTMLNDVKDVVYDTDLACMGSYDVGLNGMDAIVDVVCLRGE